MTTAVLRLTVDEVAARVGEVGAAGLVHEVLDLQVLDDGQDRGLEDWVFTGA